MSTSAKAAGVFGVGIAVSTMSLREDLPLEASSSRKAAIPRRARSQTVTGNGEDFQTSLRKCARHDKN